MKAVNWRNTKDRILFFLRRENGAQISSRRKDMRILDVNPRDIIVVIYPNGESEAWYVSYFQFHFYLISVTSGEFHETLSEMDITTIEEFRNIVSARFDNQKIQIIPDGKARITITLR
jgi:hypothetical protein